MTLYSYYRTYNVTENHSLPQRIKVAVTVRKAVRIYGFQPRNSHSSHFLKRVAEIER